LSWQDIKEVIKEDLKEDIITYIDPTKETNHKKP